MTPPELSQFHDDLRAALLAGVPIEIADQPVPGNWLTLSQAEDYQRSAVRVLDVATSDTIANFSKNLASHQDLPSRYRAALRTFEHVGTAVPVLEGLSARPLAMQATDRSLRGTLRYVGLLLLVAFLGLWMFIANIAPIIDDMRMDLRVLDQIDSPQPMYLTSWVPYVTPVLGTLIVLVALWLSLGGMRQLVWWLGGAHQVGLASLATAYRTMQLLMAAGVDATEAADLSGKLVGLQPTAQTKLNATTRDECGLKHIETLSRHCSNSAESHLLGLQNGIPITIVSVVGGLIALLYCTLIFWPITTLLTDLGRM